MRRSEVIDRLVDVKHAYRDGHICKEEAQAIITDLQARHESAPVKRVVAEFNVPDDSDVHDIAIVLDGTFGEANADATVWGSGDDYVADLVDLATHTSEEGATFIPWTDGRAVGFKVTHPDLPTRFIYLNPSTSTSTEDVYDSDVFVYEGGEPDSATTPVCYINIWSKEA